ncbi:response regulator [Fulvimarina sp. 2208YS6-2-32]|uniref:Response regulator n=1 Tax=Fulvimarina uroteuthidis TaxID=3098149 RepID=A0ABU5I040_9HYPH|nr:response regulator [Fulvimarina sp. 2208YS6-2-32]MDY8108158.1 response regulator [Fulvimarina sp. 2208YS6-2-32]
MTLTPLHILIVEDEGLIAMDIEGIIEDGGHVVVGSAVCANEAIALYDRWKPELCIIDVELLDGTTGIEVAEHIRSKGGTAFIFLTATPKRLHGDYRGGIGVLSKPFTHRQLSSTLSYLNEGLFDPPPALACPSNLNLSSAFRHDWAPRIA